MRPSLLVLLTDGMRSCVSWVMTKVYIQRNACLAVGPRWCANTYQEGAPEPAIQEGGEYVHRRAGNNVHADDDNPGCAGSPPCAPAAGEQL